jgi:hypothetical protein
MDVVYTALENIFGFSESQTSKPFTWAYAHSIQVKYFLMLKEVSLFGLDLSYSSKSITRYSI